MPNTGLPQWRFARMAPSWINQDPIQGEFFTSVSDLSERVVREAIQNSLDARRGGETVRVRFALSRTAKPLSALSAASWVDGLQPHIEAVARAESHKRSEGEQSALWQAFGLLDKPMDYLVVEDFGTTGLIGGADANSEFEEENAFWGFFRSIGISPKNADAGGSWGLGKWVFPDASLINAFIGLTRRTGEANSLLMGQAMLQTHTIQAADGAAKYPPYGFFAAASTDPDNEWLPMPLTSVESPHAVDLLIRDFDLQRGDEPGLSVVVPHPKGELTAESITRAVVVQWFFPILRGDLEVIIDAPGKFRLIDRKTISSVVEQLQERGDDGEQRRDDETRASLSGLLELARWALKRIGAPDIPEIDPSLAADDLAGGIDEELQARFDRGQPLAWRVPIRVREQGQSRRDASDSAFHVFLERDDRLSEGHDYFVRGNLRIPQMDHVRRFPVRALVIVEANTALAHLLRDAEGPAHAKWDPHAVRLKQHWSGGYQRVQDVRRAALLLVQQLTKRPEGRQMDVLADFFPDTLPGKQNGTGRNPPRGNGGSDKPKPPPLQRSPLDISRRAKGFLLRPYPAKEEAGDGQAATRCWLVRFAYDVARRNAFSEFKKGLDDGAPDFDLNSDELNVKLEDADHVVVSANELRVTPTAPHFTLEVSGFDGRDVLVEVKAIEQIEELDGAAAG